MGPGILPLLEALPLSDDPEIQARLKRIRAEIQADDLDPRQLEKLNSAATRILEETWPLEQIQNVARRNVKRLARVEKVEHGWTERPLGPRFEHALQTLTTNRRQYEGPAVIPALRPILRGKDEKRRLVALSRLDVYLGVASVTLAGDEAGRFLDSPIQEEREMAARVLLKLQSYNLVNVLKRLAEKGETEAIRQAVARLEDESYKDKK